MDYSTAVECIARDHEVVGSNLAFSFSDSAYLLTGTSKRCNSTDFPLKRFLATCLVQPGSVYAVLAKHWAEMPIRAEQVQEFVK